MMLKSFTHQGRACGDKEFIRRYHYGCFCPDRYNDSNFWYLSLHKMQKRNNLCQGKSLPPLHKLQQHFISAGSSGKVMLHLI